MRRRNPNESTSYALRQYADSTQAPESTVVQFLSRKCEEDASFDLREVVELYNGNEKKAQDVLLALAADKVITAVSESTYRVTM